jgi:hypothetical protein
MRCSDVLEVLEDYHYGELGEPAAARVRAHLSSCSPCSAELDALESEDRIYQDYSEGLDRELRLKPEMWQHIRLAIEPRPARRRHWLSLPVWNYIPGSPLMRQLVFAAALIVVSVGATLLAVRFNGGEGKPGMETASTSAGQVGSEPTGTKGLESALLSIQRAEREYIDAIRVLSEIVEKQKKSMDPRVVAEVEMNLRIIDESIAATRKAYHDHPSDPELAHYMLAAYSKKVEILQELTT